MSLAQRIVEEGEATRDAYELAGCARFAPRLEEMQAGLKRLAAENAPYIAHWKKETRAKGQKLQQQIEQAQQLFATPADRERYDEQLLTQLRQAYARELPGQSGEPLRRWLRLAQNIHGTRIEDIARKLTDAKATASAVTAKTPATVVISPKTVEVKAPQPAAASPQPAPVRPAARPPLRKKQTDDYALMWIIGTAAGTSLIVLLLMLYLFRNQFGGAPAVAEHQAALPVVAEPLVSPGPVPQNPEPGQEPIVINKPPEPSPAATAVTTPVPPAPPAPTPNKTPEPPPPMPAPMPTSIPAPMPAPAPSPSPQPTPAAGPGGRQTIGFGRAIHSLAWDGSGKLLALGGEGSDVVVWDAAKGVEARRLQDAFNSINSLSLGNGGRSLAVATTDSTVFVWNIASGKLERTIRHADLNDPRVVIWTPGSTDAQLLVGDGGGVLQTFSKASDNPGSSLTLAAEAGAIQAISYSSKRPVAVSAHLDGTVAVWNVTGKTMLKCLLTPESAIVKTLTGGGVGSSKGAELTYWGHETCLDVALSQDETLLAVAATDLELWEFDAARHMVRRRLLPGVPGAKAYRVVDFSSDGSLLAAGNAEGSLVIVDIASWTVVLQEKLASAVLCLAWHPSDPRQLAIGQENGDGLIIPLTKNIQSQKAAPDFDAEKLLETLKTVVEEEEWYNASRLLAVLSAYQLPVATRTEIDRFRAATKKGVQATIDKIDPKGVAEDDFDDAAFDLQLAIDVDSLGTLGKEARGKLRQMPMRTPATLAKKTAIEASANKTKAANHQAQPIAPNFPFGRPPGFNPGVNPGTNPTANPGSKRKR